MFCYEKIGLGFFCKDVNGGYGSANYESLYLMSVVLNFKWYLIMILVFLVKFSCIDLGIEEVENYN